MEKHERLAIQEDAVKDISVEQMKKWSGDFSNAKGGGREEKFAASLQERIRSKFQ